MLLSLRIENFALIDQLELELSSGLTVLTGETGAGKSIVLDAIDIALGGKASSRFIRTGKARAVVEATFQLNEAIARWLRDQEIDLLDEASVICSREMVTKQGNLRSRSRVNGVLVNRKIMGQLRDRLVEITAQGQTMQLLVPHLQREYLDAYGGEKLLATKATVLEAYGEFKAAQEALEKRRQSEQERWQRLDLLNFQIQELDGAELDDPDELTELEQERDRLSHVVELQNLSYQAYQLLYQSEENTAIADLLGEAENLLADMTQYDGQLEPLLEMIQGAIAQVVEAGQQINRYGDNLESDPERLTEVEERIRSLKQLCRKYGPELKDAIAHYQNLQAELAELTDSEQSLDYLEDLYHHQQTRLTQACQALSKQRKRAAKTLEHQLIQALKPLALEKVQFECRLTPIPPTNSGADRVEFYWSPNPGEPLQPLSETASGGEMSRFLLALKACFSDTEFPTSQKTLIFDEIDTGVSGKVAQAIAEKLHQLSTPHQILCVTHQPLIAALADTHFRVDKEVIDDPTPDSPTGQNGQTQLHPEPRTLVRVTPLKHHESRRNELAQLAGGHSAQDAIAFAESLLTQASNRRLGNG
ncbi:DNA repair protein RecN [Spirulina sp. CS-785/01]|uniref:DNA repair protein RecN n=1 Tax=Spirulina sp. CS-785/01 TaxID=3021716 RepID=UPI0023307F1E|nr:DNA repair protein RecN [Spirulina sp. CS-785/01]MDB9315206.1 DNA repair protein RecN [Spirulina sp. CS-785/01]